jgi:hypothetical protein
MPEPLLTTAFAVAGYALLEPLARDTITFSEPARRLAADASQTLTNAELPLSLFGPNQRAISSLAEAQQEASVEDWDGYGALPVSHAAVSQAAAFIRSLPASVPLPEVSVDPDGEVALDWLGARDQVFSISFGESSRVAYAGIDGTDRWRGAEHFDGQSIPQFLLMGIRRIAA